MNIKITAVTLAYLNATILKGQAKRLLEVRLLDRHSELIEIVYEIQSHEKDK